MSTQYFCQQTNRRAQVLGKAVINGIDYLEVTPGDQTTLLVTFLFPLPGSTGALPASPAPPLTAANVIIAGGVRVTGISVKQVSAAGNVLSVVVDSLDPATAKVAGDFSTYTLRLVTSSTNPAPPAGFDPQLSSVDFTFKVECPSDFDCLQESTCPPSSVPTASIDYLAKDYASFRQLILDRMALTLPRWQERHAPDIGIALVELLAYAGDQLSYYQDAVATEAYLGTARQRVSVRRHARLLDYFMHDGCNARAWIFFQGVGAPQLVPAQTALLTRSSAAVGRLPQAQLQQAVNQGAQVFQTLSAITAHAELNALSFYTWSDASCCLPAGATAATLVDKGAGALLKIGDLLLFEEVLGPATGAKADADPSHRQVVRLTSVAPGTDPLDGSKIVAIAWASGDALLFPLCLSTVIANHAFTDISVARGNIVLADHGQGQMETLPAMPTGNRLYRPRLQQPNLTFATAFDPVQQPAANALVQDPRQALPAIMLSSTWFPLRDLLSSSRHALNFVVETESNGAAQLRFGDGVLGSKPPIDPLKAVYRTGNGSKGNIGAEAIVNFVVSTAVPLTGVAAVRNPLPAQGGVDGETLDEVRSFAPQAFRTQERAVTEADYAVVAQRHPEVKRAQATLRWTGSWHTMFVTVDRAGGLPVDTAFQTVMRDFLEQFRLAGYDLEIEAPIFVPLDIAFTVCVAPGYFRGDVEAALLRTFSTAQLPNGQSGFFHPDHFTFGQPVYLSQVVAAAMQVPGVRWIDTNDAPPALNHFKRWGQLSRGETAAGKIALARLEIARLDNDASEPENGKIAFLKE